MLTRPVTFAVVAVAAVGVAAGSYIVTHGPAPAPTALDAPVATSDVLGAPETAVAETEATIAPEPEPAEAPAPRVAEAKPRPAAVATPARREAPRPRAQEATPPAPMPEARPDPPVAAEAPAPEPALPGLERPWPSPDPEPAVEPAGAPDTPANAQQEPPAEIFVPEPPAEPIFEDLIVSADAVIGLQLDTAVSSADAKVEDPVEARVTRDVAVGDRIAIPAGTRVQGSVVEVERGGKVKDRARLGIRFHTIVLTDGTLVPVRTETVFREGASPAPGSTAKIGGAAVGGAILGAILGGTKGAVIGGTAGAAGGTAAVMAGGRNTTDLPAGSTVTVRLAEPLTITVESEQN